MPGRPVLHTGGTGFRQATWSEAFYDLVFVVVIAQITHLIVQDPGLAGSFHALVLLVPCWWAWVNEVLYTTRFDDDEDRAKRFTGSLQLISMALLAAGIARNGGHDLRLIVGAYALVRTMQIVQTWRAGHFLAAARPLTHFLVSGHGLGVALAWLAAVIGDQRATIVCWTVGLMIEVATSVAATRFNRRFPPNVTHLPDRFGLFTILVLGEGFTGTVAGSARQTEGVIEGITVGVAIAIFIAMWWIYFDRLDDEAVEALADPDTAAQRPFLMWMGAHLPLSFAVMLTGAGADLVLSTGHLRVSAGLILCAGVGLFLAAEAIICSTAVGAGPPTLALTHGVSTRLVCMVVMLMLGAGAAFTGLPIVALLVAAGVTWAVVLVDQSFGSRIAPGDQQR